MLTVCGEICTVTLPGVAEVVTMICAVPLFVESFSEVATMVTSAGLGIFAGAVYSPVPEIVPFPLPPATAQVTAVLNVSVTVALNCSVIPTATFTPVGSTATLTTFPAVPVLHPAIAANNDSAASARAAVVIRIHRFVAVPGAIGRHSRLP